jgi:hypothetical protein
VHGAQVGVFHQADDVSLSGLLKSEDGTALEAKVVANAGGNFAHKALEGQFSDQELGALLVSPDFAEGDGARAVPMRLCGCSRRGGAGGLSRQLFSRRLTSSRLSGGLFCASHVGCWCRWRPADGASRGMGGEIGGGDEPERAFVPVLIHSPPEAFPQPCTA